MQQLEDLVAAVTAVSSLDVSELSFAELQELALAAERGAGRLRGIASRALGEVEAQQPDGTAWWWRDELGVTGEAAGIAVRRARTLRSLPVVGDAVAEGLLSLEQAGALTPLVGKLPADELTDVQPVLVDEARQLTVDGVQRWVRHLIAANNEADLEELQQAAEGQRFLKHRISADGMVRGSFALTPEDGEPFLSVLEPLARPTGTDDGRSAGQRRADALVAVFEGAARWASLPQAGGQRAQVSYVLPAEFAARLSGAAPATGAWTGPQTRSRIETTLCDARLSRVLLDGDGQVLSLLAVNDEISAGQRRAVAARDTCCIAIGCDRPPAFCDVHHLRSREDGGPTTLENLALLCRRHHVMWHQGRLQWSQLRIPWVLPWLGPPDRGTSQAA